MIEHSWVAATGQTRQCFAFCRSSPVDVRDGSDYSASIFGKLLQASAVQIWTDVDGVLSADPRKVPEAKVIREVWKELTSCTSR